MYLVTEMLMSYKSRRMFWPTYEVINTKLKELKLNTYGDSSCSVNSHMVIYDIYTLISGVDFPYMSLLTLFIIVTYIRSLDICVTGG